jgi:hypothetical protein
VIGGKKQRDHVTEEDVSSPMVLEEAVMPTCTTNVQKERDVAVASIPNVYAQTVKCDRTEQSSEQCLISVRSEAMRPDDELQLTHQSQFGVVDWRLMCPCLRKAIKVIE